MRSLDSIFTEIFLTFSVIVDSLLISLFSVSKIKKIISTISSLKFFKNMKFNLLLLFLFGILLRILLVFLIPSFYPVEANSLSGDSLGYYSSSVNGVEHGLFSTYWPPGFPFLISIVYMLFNSDTLIIMTSILIILGVLCGLLAYYISLKIFKNNMAALLAFFFICIQPSFLFHSPQIMSDTFAVLIFALSLFIVVKNYEDYKKRFPVILGILVGFLILIRPNYIFLVVSYFFFVLILNYQIKIKIKKIILFMLAITLILTPWIVYTDSIIGEPVITTNGGINLYAGNNPNATGRYLNPEGLEAMDELGRSKEGFNKAIGYIFNNVFLAIFLYIKKAFLLIFSPYNLPWEVPEHQFLNLLGTVYSLVMNIGFLILEIIGIRGIFFIKNRRNLLMFFVSLIILANLTLIVFFVDGRFILPILFIYNIFGSYYISRIIELTQKASQSNIKLPLDW